MKYIVTGGAGFIGSHIADQLVLLNHEVVIIDNLFSGNKENIASLRKNDTVSFVQGTITDLPLLQKTFEDADGIFHGAAIASVSRSVTHPLETHEANTTGTLNVLVAARDCGVRKVVLASSSAVYGNSSPLPNRENMPPAPLSPYAASKLAGEYYLHVFSEVYKLQTVSLRYFNVFGPRQDPKSQYAAVIPNFIMAVLNHKSPVIYGDGEQTRDFVFVKDVARANIKAMATNAQGVFNIANAGNINLKELAAAIMELTGIRVPLKFESSRIGDVRNSLADISQAREKLGFVPEYTVKAGLKETIEWYTQQES